MTNANDPIQSLAWVKREDGVPELNTSPNGLTKREYFAAMAMQGILAKEGYPSQELGERSAAAADALITALNTNP